MSSAKVVVKRPKILVYGLSEIAQSTWSRNVVSDFEVLSNPVPGRIQDQKSAVPAIFDLHVRIDTTLDEFLESVDSIDPDMVVFLNPILPDPRNPSDHVAVFRSAQVGSHDLVNITDLQSECEGRAAVGCVVDPDSIDIFEGIFGSTANAAVAVSVSGGRSLHGMVGSDDANMLITPGVSDRLSKALLSLLPAPTCGQPVGPSSRIANAALRIQLDFQNRRSVTDPAPSLQPRLDIDLRDEFVDAPLDRDAEREGKSIWVNRVPSKLRSIEEWPSTKSPFALEWTPKSFSVVSWVKLGDRQRQIWADTRSMGDSAFAWPAGKAARGWVMGALQYNSPTPALLFQLNTGGTGTAGWTGQNFVARGDHPINDAEWHSLTAVVDMEAQDDVKIELWVDGELDGPQSQPHNSAQLFAADYFNDTALLLGESRDAYRVGAARASDFHGDLAAVAVYPRALTKEDIGELAEELKHRATEWG